MPLEARGKTLAQLRQFGADNDRTVAFSVGFRGKYLAADRRVEGTGRRRRLSPVAAQPAPVRCRTPVAGDGVQPAVSLSGSNRATQIGVFEGQTGLGRGADDAFLVQAGR